MRLIDDAAKKATRLWSIQISIFFGLVNGAAMGLAAFVDVFNPWLFMGLNIFVYGLIAIVRLIKQDDE